MRVTSIARLANCGHQHWLLQQLPADTGSTSAASVGTAVHKALEVYNLERLRGRAPLLPDLLAAVPRNGLEDEDYEDALGMLVAYFPLTLTYQPLYVEHHWEHEDASRFLDHVEGTIDLITADMVLVDYKTGKRAWSQLDADTNVQLSLYAWGLRKNGYWKPQHQDVEVHSLTRLKRTDAKGKPRKPEDVYKAKVIRTKRNLINYEWIDETFLTPLLQGRNFPANPGNHCAWCPVREHCGFYEGMDLAREDLEWERRE